VFTGEQLANAHRSKEHELRRFDEHRYADHCDARTWRLTDAVATSHARKKPTPELRTRLSHSRQKPAD
jgi:hypothetical protein